ncbi:hypothetical protein MSSIH_0386 [Methanosarcina siciliae HI350]|uniref:PIN domain-containing protein n=1 Tax=Methanosarcina siciliae HI350 TaxID=1434119 RepID=A0A0E3L9Y4_9EURY|nr:hypothetical protein [Methanosarcina siciliae]AKB31076.1 hypothetical protein MSSIH_0386 [Methanosarcina siciliae HI350]
MIIFDASSIIYLLREAYFPRAFEISKKQGYDLAITEHVYKELETNPETFNLLNSCKDFIVIHNVDKKCISRISKRYPWLHEGEISVLCACIDKEQSGENYKCIINEIAGQLSSGFGIKANGTIDLLLGGKE